MTTKPTTTTSTTQTATWTVGEWARHIRAGGCPACQPHPANAKIRPVCTRPARTYL